MIYFLGWGWVLIVLGGEGGPKAPNIIFNKNLPIIIIIIIIIIIMGSEHGLPPLKILSLRNILDVLN